MFFFDNVGNCRKISNITQNPLFYGLDDKLKREILTSRSFLSSINYELNDIEKKYILDLVANEIRGKVDNYLKIREYFSKYYEISHANYLSKGLNLLTQIEYLIMFYVNTSGITCNIKDCMNRLSSEINSIEDNKEADDRFFNSEIKKNIFALDSLLTGSCDFNNYEEMLASVLLLKEAFKEAIIVINTPVDTEYEVLITEEKKKR